MCDVEVILCCMVNDSLLDDVDGVCVMEILDEGCCGGGCGGGSKSFGEEVVRGKFVVAMVSRVFGVVVVVIFIFVYDVIYGILKLFFDVVKILCEIDGFYLFKVVYLVFIFVTFAFGGALDCCERNVELSVYMSVLDDESEWLVGLFVDVVLGKIEFLSFDEGIVLGLVGLYMLCKFLYRFGLASVESRVVVVSKLFDVMMV